MLHYIKFFNFYCAVGLGIIALWLGGWWIPGGYALYLFIYIAGDAWLGDDLSEPALLNIRVLNAMLYGALPLAILIFITAMWLVSTDTFFIADALIAMTGIDFYQIRQETTRWQVLLSIPFLGLMIGGVGTVVAHELVHRVGSPVALCVGRWLLAFTFDTNFSIEHVYNHHLKVATSEDPATAPRGRNVYHHVLIAFAGTQKAGWQIEARRLQRQSKPTWSVYNRYLRGWGMSVVLLGCAGFLAGINGVVMFFAFGLAGKFTLEVVNYMEHYGLVRDPKKPVEMRHSWNSNRKVSCWTMFNLPRHSHHHSKGAVSFEKLRAMPDAPEMIGGYISTMALALIPPLWFRLMAPKLQHWDEHFASDNERRMLEASGLEMPRGNQKPRS